MVCRRWREQLESQAKDLDEQNKSMASKEAERLEESRLKNAEFAEARDQTEEQLSMRESRIRDKEDALTASALEFEEKSRRMAEIQAR